MIEDDREIRDLLCTLLRTEGYVVESAANGAEALSWLAAHRPPTAALLDLTMPVMDGFALRSRMLRDPDLEAIPVIVMSAQTLSDRQTALLQPAAVLPKPFEPARLLERLADIHRGHRAAPARAAGARDEREGPGR